jgi:HEAT repeat protein
MVRIRALVALEADDSPQLISALRNAMSDPASRVRFLAAQVLGEIEERARDASRDLEKALETEEKMPVRTGGPDFFDEVPNERVQRVISNALQRVLATPATTRSP